MEELTKAQEDILKAIWKVNKGAVSDILNEIPEPKPAYNTVATVVKVLEKKGYVDHETYGKTNVYFSKVSKDEYAGNLMKTNLSSFFNGSIKQFVSHFVKDKEVDLTELESLKELLEKEIKEQKK
ncbi:BlaI/MecI/CopY family transcriptional regulator [Marinigracilibium pacificum]|uniref:BlaI/MecI/CopY family transcriptional regulator n=1 Tax=Marinigracilibium pacificum TaxID=2729599 RepID=A0A848IX48_9BACT|nr:BlaI/MecI/CopY family transcriptional regulator [Marinigracilibium pacificum]NMM47855.1 BlaI/MecI/CopY family transcriptional regulator [Marinigracilibium pacificum]